MRNTVRVSALFSTGNNHNLFLLMAKHSDNLLLFGLRLGEVAIAYGQVVRN